VNLRAVAWLLGCVALLLASFLLLPGVLALAQGDVPGARAFALSAALAAAPGALLWRAFRGSMVTPDGRVDFHRREGLAAVGLSWLVAAVVGALPYWDSGYMSSPIDALFESASGFTTTGCSILSAERIDLLPKALAFWRALTHWIGGIGIVLVFVVLFPVGGRSLYRSEVVGVDVRPMAEVEVELVVPRERTGGLGVAITAHPDGIQAMKVYPGTPAWEMGLETGDVIVEVDGLPTAALTLDEFIEVMTGPEGTDVAFVLGWETDTGWGEEDLVLTRAYLDESLVGHRSRRHRMMGNLDEALDNALRNLPEGSE